MSGTLAIDGKRAVLAGKIVPMSCQFCYPNTRKALMFLYIIAGTIIASCSPEPPITEFHRMGAHDMTTSNVSGTAASAYLAQQSSSRSAAAQGAQTEAEPRVVQDKVDLSPKARDQISSQSSQLHEPPAGIRVPQTGKPKLYDGFLTQHAADRHNYAMAFDEFLEQRSQAMNEIREKLGGAANGLLSGVAFDPQNLSKPILTTDGRPHPMADAIRNFAKDHQAEFDQWAELRNQEFPSFEQWKASRA